MPLSDENRNRLVQVAEAPGDEVALGDLRRWRDPGPLLHRGWKRSDSRDEGSLGHRFPAGTR
jgi:hypothetical protein